MGHEVQCVGHRIFQPLNNGCDRLSISFPGFIIHKVLWGSARRAELPLASGVYVVFGWQTEPSCRRAPLRVLYGGGPQKKRRALVDASNFRCFN